MDQASVETVLEKLDTYIEKNDKAHDKIMKLLLGNGEIGVLEATRNNTKDIQEIKKTYTRRKMSLRNKIALVALVLPYIGTIITLALMLFKPFASMLGIEIVLK